MIKQLRIKDYILIDELTANFHEGLNVITGETGAGKSILINAIDLVFAPRVSKEVIKTGKEKAVIELVIENDKHNLSKIFDESGIDNFGSEIIISKEITPTNVRTRVNGTLVNQDFVKILKNYFLDIHSQHQTYAFMQPKYHINWLDNYAKDSYGEALRTYKDNFKQYQNMQEDLLRLKNASDMTENQIDFLKFQINEIDSASIKSVTEDEDLQKELEVLENAEKLKELTGTSYWAINGDDGSIMEALGKIKQNISKAASFDSNLEATEQRLIDAIENLKDVGSELRDYSQNLDNDTERLNQIQERLYLLDKLKHKYGGTLEAVLKTFDDLTTELNGIEFSSQNINELEQKIKEKKQELEKAAYEISEKEKIMLKFYPH